MINVKKIQNGESTCVGSGLVALDVIINGKSSTSARLCAGGSCGNVLSILAFLGWEAKPIARLAINGASENLWFDFKNFNVNTSLITRSEDGRTPIIIHRILKDKDGASKHKYEFKVPETNKWLPSYKSVLAKEVESITMFQPMANAYYFDRVSKATVNLAKYYKTKGALIIFEPSSIKEDKWYAESFRLADIIKFSNDRIPNYKSLFPSPNAELEIETLGKEGLRYRLKSNKRQCWNEMSSFYFENVVDSAGAGDWCTAGVINELGFDGAKSFYNSDEKAIESALIIGQVLGGVNCNYEGARGIMYNMNYDSLVEVVESVLDKCFRKPDFVDNKINVITIENFNMENIL